MPKATFAQRFTESFKISDRKAITNGTNIMIVVANIRSGGQLHAVQLSFHYMLYYAWFEKPHHQRNQKCHSPKKPQH